jgi:cytochrome c1
MGEAGHNRLRSFVQRVERLREEIDALNPAVPPTNSDPVATASREAGSTGEGGAVYATASPANHGAELLRKKRTRTPMTESDKQTWERAMADAYPDLRPDYVEKWGGK